MTPPGLEPIDPTLAEPALALFDAQGPTRASFVEYEPFFRADGWAVQLTGFGGTQGRLGNVLSAKALVEGVSLGIGQYHDETNGYGLNTHLRHDILTLEGKAEVTPGLRLFAAIRHRETSAGDRRLPFDLSTLLGSRTATEERISGRLGATLDLGPGQALVAVLSHAEADQRLRFEEGLLTRDDDFDSRGTDIQVQHLGRFGPVATEIGLSHSRGTRGDDLFARLDVGPPPGVVSDRSRNGRFEQTTAYGYGRLRLPGFGPVTGLALTAGLALDRVETEGLPGARTAVSPKAGLRARIGPGVSLRAAYAQTVAPGFLFDQRIEPVTVAGLAQFRPEPPGSRVRQAEIGLEARLAPWITLGARGTRRSIDADDAATGRIAEITEHEARLGADLVLTDRIAGRVGLSHQRLDSELTGDVPESRTTRLGGDLRYFHPSGLFGLVGLEQVWHEAIADGRRVEDSFPLASLALGYRLPRQRGILSLEIGNALDRDFGFEERPVRFLGAASPVDPTFPREFTVFARATLRF